MVFSVHPSYTPLIVTPSALAQSAIFYQVSVALVENRSVVFEEFARQMIYAEEMHAGEVDKMLRKPGDLAMFATRPT